MTRIISYFFFKIFILSCLTSNCQINLDSISFDEPLEIKYIDLLIDKDLSHVKNGSPILFDLYDYDSVSHRIFLSCKSVKPIVTLKSSNLLDKEQLSYFTIRSKIVDRKKHLMYDYYIKEQECN